MRQCQVGLDNKYYNNKYLNAAKLPFPGRQLQLGCIAIYHSKLKLCSQRRPQAKASSHVLCLQTKFNIGNHALMT
jgi:hypothetical protein